MRCGAIATSTGSGAWSAEECARVSNSGVHGEWHCGIRLVCGGFCPTKVERASEKRRVKLVKLPQRIMNDNKYGWVLDTGLCPCQPCRPSRSIRISRVEWKWPEIEIEQASNAKSTFTSPQPQHRYHFARL